MLVLLLLYANSAAMYLLRLSTKDQASIFPRVLRRSLLISAETLYLTSLEFCNLANTIFHKDLTHDLYLNESNPS